MKTGFVLGAVFAAFVGWGRVQAQEQTPVTTPDQSSQQAPSQTLPPKGTVIFQKDDKTDAVPDADASSPTPSSSNSSSSSQPLEKAGPADADVTVSDDEREAVTFTAYDLDLHLTPATAGIEAHVNFTVRNDGKVPLTTVAVQLSSSLVWESLRVRTGSGGSFVQHRINTDADQTGVAREAVLTLPQALAPGAAVELTGFYTGTIAASAERLERIGAPEDQAAIADWDAISTGGAGSVVGTALRGYGDVLWYPAAGAPVFLGDGAKLFDAVGRARQRQQSAMTRLRLTIAYTGDAPDAAYFCGRREPLTHTSENDGLPVAESPGIATAKFRAQPLGFRVPSLFVTERASTTTDGGLIQAVTDNADALERYTEAAAKVQPLLMDWLGTEPLGPLMVIDHTGQPFEDGALLVAPMQAAPKDGAAAALAPVMAHTLTHAWFGSSHAWLDEGVAQFLSLLWLETNDGRQAGLDRLQSANGVLALAEPAAGSKSAGQSLVDASSEIYYRTKAAAVLWMLRGIVGDEALKKALQAYRKNRSRSVDTRDASADGFQRVLEETAGRPRGDLQWFFDDWVYRDKGLPDLSIAHVSPRPLPEKGGKSDGWLVAVDVRNDGDAVAEVPVTVRSGELTATERLRIPGRSNAATRILFQGTPAEVIVNDGSVPEVAESLHIKKVVLKAE